MSVTQLCSRCQRPVPAEAHTCPHCGASLQALDHGLDVLPQMHQAPSTVPTTPSHALPTAEHLPDVLKQLDAAATTNITISGVLVAFYAGSLFSGKVSADAPLRAFIYALPLLLLLVTIILSVRVFYPEGYLNRNYKEQLTTKQQRMRLSSLFLEISIALVVLAIFVYLLRPGA